MRIFSALALMFFLNSCGQQEGFKFEFAPTQNISMTTFTLAITPTDLSTDVPLNYVIRVGFSDQIAPSSVDNFTFRIENENNQPMEGEITISPDYKELSFARRIAGQPATWEPDTTYTVYTRFLKDPEGNYIADKSAQFTTQSMESGQTGAFVVSRVTPTQETFYDYILNVRPDSPITVEFSLPVYPNTPICDTPVLRNAIQLINVDIGDSNNSLNIPPMDAQICLECPAPNYCNRIVARPRTRFADNSLLLIMARPGDQFFGLTGDGRYERLADTFVKERFVSFNHLWP